MDLPKRKPNRLPNFDYNTPGAYFVTICTQNRQNLLCRIVGGGALDAPQVVLSSAGKIARKYILSGNNMEHVTVDHFVIMPNHIHLILMVNYDDPCGTPRASSPTNSQIPRFVAAFKRFCHQDIGHVIFQRSYHDHIIRGERDYLKIWEYIDTNPARWKEDCFYKEDIP